MKKILLTLMFFLGSAIPAAAVEGMVTVPSTLSVEETAERMESVLQEKGMTIFNRIKHSAGAGKVGIELRKTELILFGNPKVGSPLMKCKQSVAIDLPQKALIWEDVNEKVWISYNDPRYLEQRHSISGCDKILSKIEKALAGIARLSSAK